ncbi:MAG: dockerin type I repeat-containing protein [Candidatus Methanoplasma sp.]|jgi:ABC-type Fe3+-hydroxamate transport system substrate-binding protein|nr:dockerin type I repeat-containing protein [Candidatus Methanoplasma sp.]
MISKTKLAVIAVVAIVAVAAIGIAVLVNGDKERVTIDAQLEVYGNANNDDRIDDGDIAVIEKIIAGDLSFDDHPLADANYDGKVDQADIDMVRQIIDADSSHKVRIYHVNHFDGKSVVADTLYPITSAVSTGAANSILIYKYLGIVSEIKGLSYSVVPDSVLFSEYQGIVNESKRLETSSTRINVDKVSNLVTGEGVTAAITADNRSYLANEEKQLEAMGVDVVRVQPASVDSGEYMSTILMIAFLFDTDGKGYMERCGELTKWYEDFLTDLGGKLSKVKDRVSAVASSSNTSVSTSSSDYTEALIAAGATFPLADRNAASASDNYNGASDTWLNKYELDYVVCIRTSAAGFSWYGGTADTAGKATLTGYINNFKTLKCYQEGKNVYVLCGDMPVMLRIAYAAQIFYPGEFGSGYAEGLHIDFAEKFFGWDESMVKGKAFYVSMDGLGIAP